jgi:cyclopropane fatty-acyl-phospholipid synthase-like methyltransferase
VCIKQTGLTTDSRILNVGSGLGGPARYFGGKLGASVLAVELQDDLHRTATELTARCGLTDNVHHLVRSHLSLT